MQKLLSLLIMIALLHVGCGYSSGYCSPKKLDKRCKTFGNYGKEYKRCMREQQRACYGGYGYGGSHGYGHYGYGNGRYGYGGIIDDVGDIIYGE